MLISHRYRFIYTKTAKTASTSVESFFERFCMPEGEWKQSHGRNEYQSSSGIIGFRGSEVPKGTKWWHHMPAFEIKKLIGPEIWDSYFKFCVVRNPFEKCISAFCHLGKDHQLEEGSDLNGTQYQDMSLEQRRFLDYIQRAAPMDRNNFLIDGKFCLDDFIRYESLEADIERICLRIGVPFEKEYLPRFKTEFRGKEATVETLYTEESRALVKEKFAFELQYFGYDVADT